MEQSSGKLTNIPLKFGLVWAYFFKDVTQLKNQKISSTPHFHPFHFIYPSPLLCYFPPSPHLTMAPPAIYKFLLLGKCEKPGKNLISRSESK